MALDQSALTDLPDALRSGGDLDFIREAVQLVLQALIDLEATERIGPQHPGRGYVGLGAPHPAGWNPIGVASCLSEWASTRVESKSNGRLGGALPGDPHPGTGGGRAAWSRRVH